MTFISHTYQGTLVKGITDSDDFIKCEAPKSVSTPIYNPEMWRNPAILGTDLKLGHIDVASPKQFLNLHLEPDVSKINYF